MSVHDTPEILAQAVLAAGDELISSLREGGAESLALLERYVECFDSWEKTWAGDGRPPALPEGAVEMGRRVAERHATVMELVEEMRDAVGGSLKDLPGKTKGLKAYIDTLPRQIGTIRPRKG